jgi:hypothetical protein
MRPKDPMALGDVRIVPTLAQNGNHFTDETSILTIRRSMNALIHAERGEFYSSIDSMARFPGFGDHLSQWSEA